MFRGYFDGSTPTNPGPSAIGAVLIDKNGEIIWEKSMLIGHCTNTVAEYKALIVLLRELKRRGINNCQVYGDSQLVVNQVNGDWSANEIHLRKLRDEAVPLLGKNLLAWIPRKENLLADNLSRAAFKGKKTHSIIPSAAPIKVLDGVYGIFLIRSSCGEKVYVADLDNEACTCPAFVYGRTRPCKHMLFVQEHLLKEKLSEVSRQKERVIKKGG